MAVARVGGDPSTQASGGGGGGAAASKLLTAAMITRCLSEGGQVQIIQPSDQPTVALSSELTDSDLLSQAMTELPQSFGTEFRLVTANMSTGSEFQTVVPCIVSVSSTAAVDQGLQAAGPGPALGAGSDVVFSPQMTGLRVSQVVQKPAQILHTIPKTVSSTFYPLPCISATAAVTKNVV